MYSRASVCVSHMISFFMRLYLLLIVSLFVGMLSLRAQQPNFIQYTIESGLPSNEVYDVIEDSQGYLWFCTDKGVSKYDGHTFQNYTTEHGLMNNTVFKGLEDDKGRIWFLTFDARLSYYKDGSINPFKYNKEIAELNVMDSNKELLFFDENGCYVICSYRSFFVDNSGNAKVLANEFGINLLKSKKGGYIPYMGSFIRSDTAQNKRAKLIGIDKSLHAIKYHNDNPIHFTLYNMNGGTLFSPLRELFFVKDDSIEYLGIFDKVIDCFAEDSRGGFWMGFLDGGAKLFSNKLSDLNHQKHLLHDKSIASILEDREGGFWFSVLGEGVYYAPSLYGIQCFSEKLPDEKVADICLGKNDDVYVSFSSGSIWKLNDKETKKIHTIDRSIRHGGFNPIYYDRKKDILFYSTILEDLFDKNRESIARALIGIRERLYKPQDLKVPIFTTITPDKNGDMWATALSDFFQFPNNESIRIHKSQNLLHKTRHPYHLRTDALLPNFNNTTWFSSVYGLLRIENNEPIPYSEKHPLLKSRINVIKNYKDSLMLLGSRDEGLIILVDDSVYQIKKEHGLSDNTVNTIAVDSNNIVWAGTNSGLNKITFAKNGNYFIKHYSTAHGLPSNHITKLLMGDSKIWVGTIRGLCFIDKGTLHVNTVPPLVHINKWNINGETVDKRKNITLKHDQNFMLFHYTGITFNNSKNIMYAYRLEGLEKKWKSTRNASVQYNSLPSGEYTFMVKARNADGYWSDPVSLSFVIAPPFWKASWFLVMIGLAITLIFYLILRRRDRSVANKAALEANFLRQKTQLKLEALRAQMNPHFTFNTLNSIQVYIAKNDSQSANHYLAKFARLIRKILENSSRTTITLENELDTIQKYLELEKLRFKDKLDYRIDIDDSVNLRKDVIPPTIFQPYIENAIIHGIIPKKSNGLITIRLEKKDLFLICKITDNGIGRKRAKQLNSHKQKDHKSMGLNMTKTRLELMTGAQTGSVNITDLEDANGNPAGTCVELKIPVMEIKHKD